MLVTPHLVKVNSFWARDLFLQVVITDYYLICALCTARKIWEMALEDSTCMSMCILCVQLFVCVCVCVYAHTGVRMHLEARSQC